MLFPFGVGPEPEAPAADRRRHHLGRGAARRAVVASTGCSQPIIRMAGSICWRLSALPLEFAVLAKCAAHWVTTGLPLALISPFLALLVDLDPAAIPILCSSLADRHPGAEPARRRRRGADPRRPAARVSCSSLLVLPLYVPPLIFGAGAVEASVAGAGARAHLLLLGALPWPRCRWRRWASAAALRQALE